MINNIDEAIKHCEEEAEEQQRMGERNYDDDCLEYAKEYRQLAEWLRKLKAYEGAREEIGCLPILWREDVGVRSCIGILNKHLMEVNDNDGDCN